MSQNLSIYFGVITLAVALWSSIHVDQSRVLPGDCWPEAIRRLTDPMVIVSAWSWAFFWGFSVKLIMMPPVTP